MNSEPKPPDQCTDELSERDGWAVDRVTLTDLIVDLWRIRRRAHRDEATPVSVRVACEIALDRIAALGFRMDGLVGTAYDPSMRIRVVDQEGGSANLRITECLSPAVYRDDKLVRQAEVIVRGE